MSDDFETLEDAVWKRAAGDDPQLGEKLGAALARHPAERKPKQGLWERLLDNPLALGSLVLAAAGAYLQSQDANLERTLNMQKAKMEIRSKLIDSYLAAKEPGDKLAVLNTAIAIPSVMAKCKEGPGESEPDCVERMHAAAWVELESKNIDKASKLRESLLPSAIAKVAERIGGTESEVEDPVNMEVYQAAVEQEVTRLAVGEEIAELRKSVAASPEASEPPPPPPAPPKASARDRAKALWNRGYDAFTRGDLKTARGYYEDSKKEDPTYHAALNSIGRMEVEDGQIEAGIEHYKNALKDAPKYGPALYNLVLAYAKSGKKELAKDAWSKATQANPSYPMRSKVRDRVARDLRLPIEQLP